METLLQKIYDELKYLKKVRNQTDFGDKLDYNKGWTSSILKRSTPLTAALKDKLVAVFGISRSWLDSEGKIGTMFGAATKNKDDTNNNHSSDEPQSAEDLYDVDLSTNKNVSEMMKDLLMLYKASTEVALTLARANENLSAAKVKDADSMNILMQNFNELVHSGGVNFQKAG